MKHASLFSGIGGAELAATWMGWENVFHCEINEFPRKVLEYWYPNSVSYEDITTTDFTSWRGKVDILTGGFPCFVAGTPVLTKDGFTSIEDVRNGQEVLSTDGKYHTVECTMSHVADMITYMRAQGMYNSLKCTPNHPFYIRKKITKRGRNCYLPPQYIKAGDIKKGDKVGYPIHEGADKSFSIDFWKLVGTWLADGWTDCAKRKSKIPKGHRGSRVNSTNHKVYICCGKKNITRLHHIIQRAGFKYTLSEEKSVFKAIICDKWLCDFLQDFGKYAHGKHLSPQCFELDAERKSALFKGWMADGYRDKGGSFKVTTVSEKLALDMAQIARDTFKCPVSISKKTVKRTCVIENRKVNERPQYCVTVSNSDRYGFYEDGFLWCNIKFVETKREINNVYNLSVKDEHSYNVWGIAVHNCQPFSMAGKRLGAEDDRYLWPHMLRAIREIQPTWVVGENVAGLVTMVQPSEEFEVGGQASLFEENYRTREEQPYTIEEICQGLEREGYSIQPFVIPACAVGAPHRRDRVWLIATVQTQGLKICENGKSIPMNLTLLPTPTAKDGQGGGANKLTNGKRCRLSGQVFSATLKDLAAGKLLPTPRAMDCKTGTPMESKKYNRDTDLRNFVAKRAGQTSLLNPLFVGEMMGFPLDWLTLPFQNGEQRALKP